MENKRLIRTNNRKHLEMASDHVMEYYGFHWPADQLQVLFENPKGVFYISHQTMGGLIITVKRDEIFKRYIVRSFKHQFAQARPIEYIDKKYACKRKEK